MLRFEITLRPVFGKISARWRGEGAWGPRSRRSFLKFSKSVPSCWTSVVIKMKESRVFEGIARKLGTCRMYLKTCHKTSRNVCSVQYMTTNALVSVHRPSAESLRLWGRSQNCKKRPLTSPGLSVRCRSRILYHYSDTVTSQCHCILMVWIWEVLRRQLEMLSAKCDSVAPTEALVRLDCFVTNFRHWPGGTPALTTDIGRCSMYPAWCLHLEPRHSKVISFLFATFPVIAAVFEVNTAVITDVTWEYDAFVFRVGQ